MKRKLTIFYLLPMALWVTLISSLNANTSSELHHSPPLELTLDFEVTHVRCYGESNGLITAHVTGGARPYTYVWISGQTDSTITNLIAGDYTLVVIDSLGESITRDVTILQPEPFQASIIFSDTILTCFNDSLVGRVNVYDQSGPFDILWTLPDATTVNIDTLPITMAGIYQALVMNQMGCEVVLTDTIQSYGIPDVTTHVIQNVRCFNQSNGSGYVSITGQIAPITISWSNGMTNDTIIDLSHGQYYVTVTDTLGCQVVKALNITQPAQLDIEINSFNNNCYGDQSGAAMAVVSGGIPPYDYLWSNGDTLAINDYLAADLYYVTVTDNNRCSETAFTVITQGEQIFLNTGSVAVKCHGDRNGVVFASPSGGAGNFTFQWSNGSTSSSQANLPAGQYIVTVIDEDNCALADTVIVGSPQPLDISFTVEPETTTGNNGSANAMVTGGNGNYTYLWSTGATTPRISNVPTGNYMITVTDVKGCSILAMIFVPYDPCTLQAQLDIAQEKCVGANNGSIFVDITHAGLEPYSFQWSNGETEFYIDDLAPGEYTVTVSDNLGCHRVYSGTVNSAVPLMIDTVVTQPVGEGGLGSINVKISGGKGPYRVNLNGVEYFTVGDIMINGLKHGEYVIVVKDINNCEWTAYFRLIPGDCNLILSIIETKPIRCFGEKNGEICLRVNNNRGPYSIIWSNNSPSSCITNIGKGNYGVNVIDSVGCKGQTNTFINEPDTIIVDNVEIKNATETSSGSIFVYILGGTQPFDYQWEKNGEFFSTSRDIENLTPGVYTLTATDSRGCTVVIGPIAIITLSTGIGDLKELIKVYPNPAKDHLVITELADMGLSKAKYSIINANGNVAQVTAEEKRNNEVILNLKDLAAGYYTLQINLNGNLYHQKVILLE